MSTRKWMFLLIAGLVFWIAPAPSVQAQDIARISPEELKGMIEKGAPVIIVDNRPKAEFDRQHIQGAVSLPWAADAGEQAKKTLPSNKMIVTYCDCGPGESDSADVANQLILAGFNNVKTLADGWTPWLQSGSPVERGRK